LRVASYFSSVTIGTLYPAYRSYKSLINSDLREVVNCLRYWTVFAIFIACETITDIILSWFPFYYWIKIGILLWIVSPAGSTFLYKQIIQPLLREREQEIDQLLEHTKNRSYSALLDLTNKGIRYASNAFLNTAVLGQTFLGEHLKRSLSTSDINIKASKNPSNRPVNVDEESEGESDREFTNRLREDQRYISKGSSRKPLSHYQEKPEDTFDNPSDEYKVSSRKARNVNNGAAAKRPIKGTKPTKHSAVSHEHEGISSNDTDEEIENIRRRT